MPARSKRPAALLLAVGFGVGIVAAAIATGLGARAVSADVSATWIGPPTYPNGCAGGTFWGGAGECATIQNYGTWYGAYYGVSTSSGFSLGDIATSQVFCAEQPASGKWFPDPSYGYTEQNTPTTGEGAAWLDALAFAEGQQYHYDGGVVGSADQGEGTKLAIDYGLFGSTYGSPSSGWSGADSAAVTYADQLIAEANAMSGAQVGPNSWAYAVTDNTPSSTWQDGQPASIGFTLQSSNNVGVYDQPVTVTISGGTWDNGSNSVTVTTGNNAPGGNPAGNVPTLTFTPSSGSTQVSFTFTTTLPQWRFPYYTPSAGYSSAQDVTGPAPVNNTVTYAPPGISITPPKGGRIEIDKYGSPNVGSTAGATFSVANYYGVAATYEDGTSVGPLTTGGWNGNYSVATTADWNGSTQGLTPGYYWVTETNSGSSSYGVPASTTSPNPYVNPWKVDVTSGATTVQEVYDPASVGTLVIVKQDQDSLAYLNGATFTVTSSSYPYGVPGRSPNCSTTFSADPPCPSTQGGCIVLSNLPAGVQYTVTETTPPPSPTQGCSYLLPSSQNPTVQAGSTPTTVNFSDKLFCPVGGLALNKVSTATGDPVGGATFEVLAGSSSPSSPYGTPACSATGPFNYTVTAGSFSTQSYDTTNFGLSYNSTWSGTGAGPDLPNLQLTCGSGTSAYGYWELVETTTPSGYQTVQGTPVRVLYNASFIPTLATVPDTPLASGITVTKNGNDPYLTIGGASPGQFTVIGPCTGDNRADCPGASLATFTVNSSIQVGSGGQSDLTTCGSANSSQGISCSANTLNGLIPGDTYDVWESNVPYGYSGSADVFFTAAANGQVDPITVSDTYIASAVTTSKACSPSGPACPANSYGGAIFTVQGQGLPAPSGVSPGPSTYTQFANLISNPNGSMTCGPEPAGVACDPSRGVIENAEPGYTYTFTEVAAPPGFVPVTSPYPTETAVAQANPLPDSPNAVVAPTPAFQDVWHPNGSVSVTKTANDPWQAVAGAVFNVVDVGANQPSSLSPPPTGTLVGEIAIGSDGTGSCIASSVDSAYGASCSGASLTGLRPGDWFVVSDYPGEDGGNPPSGYEPSTPEDFFVATTGGSTQLSFGPEAAENSCLAVVKESSSTPAPSLGGATFDVTDPYGNLLATGTSSQVGTQNFAPVSWSPASPTATLNPPESGKPAPPPWVPPNTSEQVATCTTTVDSQSVPGISLLPDPSNPTLGYPNAGYTVTEETGPTGYAPPPPPPVSQTVFVGPNQAPASLTFTDQPAGYLSVAKASTVNPPPTWATSYSGASFTVLDSSNAVRGTVTYNPDGTVSFTGATAVCNGVQALELPAGPYQIQETHAPSGYPQNPLPPKASVGLTAGCGAGGPTVVTVSDPPLGALAVTKSSTDPASIADGFGIAGARFALYSGSSAPSPFPTCSSASTDASLSSAIATGVSNADGTVSLAFPYPAGNPDPASATAQADGDMVVEVAASGFSNPIPALGVVAGTYTVVEYCPAANYGLPSPQVQTVNVVAGEGSTTVAATPAAFADPAPSSVTVRKSASEVNPSTGAPYFPLDDAIIAFTGNSAGNLPEPNGAGVDPTPSNWENGSKTQANYAYLTTDTSGGPSCPTASDPAEPDYPNTSTPIACAGGVLEGIDPGTTVTAFEVVAPLEYELPPVSVTPAQAVVSDQVATFAVTDAPEGILAVSKSVSESSSWTPPAELSLANAVFDVCEPTTQAYSASFPCSQTNPGAKVIAVMDSNAQGQTTVTSLVTPIPPGVEVAPTCDSSGNAIDGLAVPPAPGYTVQEITPAFTYGLPISSNPLSEAVLGGQGAPDATGGGCQSAPELFSFADPAPGGVSVDKSSEVSPAPFPDLSGAVFAVEGPGLPNSGCSQSGGSWTCTYTDPRAAGAPSISTYATLDSAPDGSATCPGTEPAYVTNPAVAVQCGSMPSSSGGTVAAIEGLLAGSTNYRVYEYAAPANYGYATPGNIAVPTVVSGLANVASFADPPLGELSVVKTTSAPTTIDPVGASFDVYYLPTPTTSVEIATASSVDTCNLVAGYPYCAAGFTLTPAAVSLGDQVGTTTDLNFASPIAALAVVPGHYRVQETSAPFGFGLPITNPDLVNVIGGDGAPGGFPADVASFADQPPGSVWVAKASSVTPAPFALGGAVFVIEGPGLPNSGCAFSAGSWSCTYTDPRASGAPPISTYATLNSAPDGSAVCPATAEPDYGPAPAPTSTEVVCNPASGGTPASIGGLIGGSSQYEAFEYSPPADYSPDTSDPRTFPTIQPSSAVSVTFTDVPYGTFQIDKFGNDTPSNAGILPSGPATFDVCKGTGPCGSGSTPVPGVTNPVTVAWGAPGSVCTDCATWTSPPVPAGVSYTATEIAAPPGYCPVGNTSLPGCATPPPTSATVTVNAGELSPPAVASVKDNAVTGTIDITKYGSDTPFAPTGGSDCPSGTDCATFSVTNSASKQVGTVTTGPFATACQCSTGSISGLLPGSYTLTETTPPPGYAAAPAQTVTVASQYPSATAATATFVDEVLTGSIMVEKYGDATPIVPTDGAEFTIVSGPSNVGLVTGPTSSTSPSAGGPAGAACVDPVTGQASCSSVEIPNLVPGNYCLQETQTPPNYKTPTDPTPYIECVTLPIQPAPPTPGITPAIDFTDKVTLGLLRIDTSLNGPGTLFSGAGALYDVTGGTIPAGQIVKVASGTSYTTNSSGDAVFAPACISGYAEPAGFTCSGGTLTGFLPDNTYDIVQENPPPPDGVVSEQNLVSYSPTGGVTTTLTENDDLVPTTLTVQVACNDASKDGGGSLIAPCQPVTVKVASPTQPTDPRTTTYTAIPATLSSSASPGAAWASLDTTANTETFTIPEVYPGDYTFSQPANGAPPGYSADSTVYTSYQVNPGTGYPATPPVIFHDTIDTGTLTIVKTCNDANKDVSGTLIAPCDRIGLSIASPTGVPSGYTEPAATYTSSNGDGHAVLDSTNNNTETITFAGVFPADYTVTETAAPAGYSLDSTAPVTQPVYPAVAPFTTAAFTFSDTVKAGTLTIVKSCNDASVDSATGKLIAPCDGIGFSIASPAGVPSGYTEPPATYTSANGDGHAVLNTTTNTETITFTGVFPADYTVTETAAPAGYSLDSSAPVTQPVYPAVAPFATAPFAFSDTVKAGTLTVVKSCNDASVDSATGRLIAPCDGIGFTIASPAGVPSGYTEPPATYTSSNGDGHAVLNTATNTETITFAGVFPADYTVQETGAPAGYSIDSSAPVTQPVYPAVAPFATAPFTFSDTVKAGTLTIVKSCNYTVACDNVTFTIGSPPTPGYGYATLPATFTTTTAQYDAGTNTTTATFPNVFPGDYTVTETVAPAGYNLASPSSLTQPVYPDATGFTTAPFDYLDPVKPVSLTVAKSCNDLDTSTVNCYSPTQPVTFTFSGPSAPTGYTSVPSGTYTPPASDYTPAGCTGAVPASCTGVSVTFGGLFPGAYSVDETQAPAGYDLPAVNPTPVDLTVPGTAGTATIVDPVQDGNFNLAKLGSFAKKSVDGAAFTLTDPVNGETYGPYTVTGSVDTTSNPVPANCPAQFSSMYTNVNLGCLMESGIVPGTYLLTESAMPSSKYYNQTSIPTGIDIPIYPNATKAVEVEDGHGSGKGSGLTTTVDPGTNADLSGAVFEVTGPGLPSPSTDPSTGQPVEGTFAELDSGPSGLAVCPASEPTTVTCDLDPVTGAAEIDGLTSGGTYSVTQLVAPAGFSVANPALQSVTAGPHGDDVQVNFIDLASSSSPPPPPPPSGGPVVTGIDPTSGPTAGGTTVTLTGTGFTGATGVSFGTVAATSFACSGDTSCSATSPAEGAGTVDVTVTTPAGTSATTNGDQFTYLAPTGTLDLVVLASQPGSSCSAPHSPMPTAITLVNLATGQQVAPAPVLTEDDGCGVPPAPSICPAGLAYPSSGYHIACGQVTNLVAGTYQISEAVPGTPDDGYLDSSTLSGGIQFTLAGGETLPVVGVEYHGPSSAGSLSVVLTDSSAGSALPGGVFSVSGPITLTGSNQITPLGSLTVVGTLASASGGAAVSLPDLVQGIYLVSEVSAPSGYATAAPELVDVSGSSAATVGFTNSAGTSSTGNLAVVEVGASCNKSVAGAAFALTGPSSPPAGTVADSICVNSAATGSVTFTGLAAGSYSVGESTAPTHYKGGQSGTGDVSAGELTIVEITDQP